MSTAFTRSLLSITALAFSAHAFAHDSISSITQIAIAVPTFASVNQGGVSGSTSEILQAPTAAATATPLLATVFQADAGGLGPAGANLSRVVQAGFVSGAFAQVQQTNTGGPNAGPNRSTVLQGGVLTPSADAAAGVLQLGEGNTAKISQTAGLGPQAAITQTGAHNGAAIHQERANGAGAQAFQVGEANTITINQEGRPGLGSSGLNAGIVQLGDYNSAHVVQSGVNLVVDALQEGAANTLHVSQSSAGGGPSVIDVVQQ